MWPPPLRPVVRRWHSALPTLSATPCPVMRRLRREMEMAPSRAAGAPSRSTAIPPTYWPPWRPCCRSALLSHTALNWLRLGAPERGLSCAEEAVKLKPQALCGHVACAAVLAAVDRAHDAQAALAGAVALKPHLDHAFVEAMNAYSDPTDA